VTRWVPLLLVASAALAGEAEVRVALDTEARARSPFPADVGAGPIVDLELRPLLGGRITTSAFLLEAGYRPVLLFRDLVGGGPVLPLQRANASVQWQPTDVILRASAEGARGTVDLGPLLVLDGTPVGQPSATTTVGLVDYVRGAASLSLALRLGSRLSLEAEGGYEISGSQTNIALPLQWGPTAAARVRWATSEVDHFTTALEARHADFITGHRQTLVESTQLWARRLNRLVLIESTLGAAVVQQDAPAGEVAAVSSLGLVPIAGVAGTLALPVRGSKLEVLARARLAPFADRFTATVYERVSASTGVAWTFHRTLTMAAMLSAARSFPPPLGATPPDVLLSVESSLSWAVQPWLSLGVTMRAVHVEVLIPNGGGQNQWLTGLSVTLSERAHVAWK
jgi:hypothetical protein